MRDTMVVALQKGQGTKSKIHTLCLIIATFRLYIWKPIAPEAAVEELPTWKANCEGTGASIKSPIHFQYFIHTVVRVSN